MANTSARTYIIAVLPGDGIGLEVMPPALRCLEAAAKAFSFNLEFRHYPWASCTYYHQHGKMLPDDWKELLKACDAIYFGAGMYQHSHKSSFFQSQANKQFLFLLCNLQWAIPLLCPIISPCGVVSSSSDENSTST